MATRQRYCKACKGWHDLDAPWPDECATHDVPARSPLPFPMVIRDEMEPGIHPHDMREHTSKSSWRAANRAGGYIEVGNDPARFKTPSRPKPQGIRESLMRAKARVGI